MTVRLLIGDCREVLKTLPDCSIQMCVTSPPYFGLRDYGVSGQLGLEKTPDEYVANMVAVFREVRRVLRDDGTLWLNLGDSYAGSWKNQGRKETRGTQRPINGPMMQSFNGHPAPDSNAGVVPDGLKPKDLVGIPWRVAFALQADGWYLRSDIIWHKPNPMPESVTDRPTKAHEYLFLLTKSASYFYDADAIKEESTWGRENNPEWQYQRAETNARKGAGNRNAASGGFAKWDTSQGRNRRSVWSVATRPYKGAHFATFPPKLIEPCILAGTSQQSCEHCAAPWERVTERTPMQIPERNSSARVGVESTPMVNDGARRRAMNGQVWAETARSVTTGWQPMCDCPDNIGSARCVVLDPFGGAGTTGLVADRLGRDAVLIELNKEYTELGTDRITDDAPLFANVHVGNGNGHV